MDLQRLQEANPPVQELVSEYGREAVVDELWDLCTRGYHFEAFRAARLMEEDKIVHFASGIILCSSDYSSEIQTEVRSLLGTVR